MKNTVLSAVFAATEKNLARTDRAIDDLLSQAKDSMAKMAEQIQRLEEIPEDLRTDTIRDTLRRFKVKMASNTIMIAKATERQVLHKTEAAIRKARRRP